MLYDAIRQRLAARYPTKPKYSDLFGPTERASAYDNNDAFDEAFFANENIILCDSYKQLLVEKRQYDSISLPPVHPTSQKSTSHTPTTNTE